MRTNPWLEKSKINLLALSESKDFKDALSEWFFTGDVEDYGDRSVDCELCEHPELRYHYEIENKIKNSNLWVGSSCILRFQEIEVYDVFGNRLLDNDERSIELQKQLKKQMENKMLDPIRALWKLYIPKSPDRLHIETVVRKYKSQSSFTPKDLLEIFDEMSFNNIEFSPERYKISLRGEYDKWTINSLSQKNLLKLKPCFSPNQLNKYSHLFNTNK
jgi:hypothetical protein